MLNSLIYERKIKIKYYIIHRLKNPLLGITFLELFNSDYPSLFGSLLLLLSRFYFYALCLKLVLGGVNVRISYYSLSNKSMKALGSLSNSIR